jgi:hypothetical protein
MENQTPQEQIDTIYATRIKLNKLKNDYEKERKQLLDEYEKYCISISPYKIGDRYTDEEFGVTIIIDCIKPHYWIFDEDYRLWGYTWEKENFKYPFTYGGYKINANGKPSKCKRIALFPKMKIK